MPAKLTAHTGMDAMTHAIEAYVSTLNCEYTDPLALHAIEMIHDNLKKSYEGDMACRDKMHNAQCLAGMAFSNALLGIVHSMAHKTGAAFTGGHIIHGCANAMYLPKVIKYNSKDPVAAERYAKIAKFINLKGETTEELVNIIEKSIPAFAKKDGHPAKRTFQAIRIEVNNEIKPIYDTVMQCIKHLKPEGRLCIITFHSLEDRAVKKAYTDAEGKCTCPKDLPYCVCGAKSEGKIINKKPIIATEEEQRENSRSKSAKLRIFEKK